MDCAHAVRLSSPYQFSDIHSQKILAFCVSHLKIFFLANFSILFPSILSLKNLFRLTTQAQCEHKYKDEQYCVVKDGHDILERLKHHLHAVKNKHGTPNFWHRADDFKARHSQ